MKDKPHVLYRYKLLSFSLALLLMFLAGAYFRLKGITSQVLLDDEWHGLYYVTDKSLGWLLTHCAVPGANSMAYNVYRWILLHTIGWNETVLRLPSLVSGILLAGIFPLLAMHRTGRRGAVLLAGMLAISPFLILYSRFCRAYGMTSLTTAAALGCASLWVARGSRRWAIGYLLCAMAASYAHILAVFAVAVPLGVMYLILLLRRWKPHRFGSIPGIKDILAISGVLLLFLVFLVIPPSLQAMSHDMSAVVHAGGVTPQSLWRFAAMLFGTSNAILVPALCLVALYGTYLLLKDSLFDGLMYLAVYGVYAMFFLITQPACMDAPIVMARYCIPIFPVTLLLAARGIENLGRRIPARTWNLLIPVLPIFLWLAGPVPHIYRTPNNFMHHSCFQQDYGPIDWDTSFISDISPKGPGKPDLTVHFCELHVFYQEQAQIEQHDPIIIFPMLVGDYFNLMPFLQHYLARPVIVGYSSQYPERIFPNGRNHVYGNMYAGQILSVVSNPAHTLRLSNMVDLEDAHAVEERGARYLVLNKNPGADLAKIAEPHPRMSFIEEMYRKRWGEPLWSDERIVVFQAPSSAR